MKHKYLPVNNKSNFLNPTIILAMLLFVASSCKKEYPSLPYTEIVSFSIKDNNGSVLKAAIVNNEITLYWPPEQAVPETITPVITLSDKATIQPASDTPVAFSENTTFTVTAEDGSKVTYKLAPTINYTKPYVSTITSVTTYKDKTYKIQNQRFIINGDYFNPDATATKVFLVSADKTEVPATIALITAIRITVTSANPGAYNQVKVVTNNRTVLFNFPLEVVAADPKPNIFTPVLSISGSIKRGQQFTVTGGVNMNVSNKIELFNAATGNRAELRLVTAKNDSWILEVPADFPLGDYTSIQNTYPESAYYAEGTIGLSTATITITQ